ncbi:MAG TPA: hypothetical protein VF556_17725 [Pyrinomonadaceae bacterium]|jgi:hypothetical protein
MRKAEKQVIRFVGKRKRIDPKTGRERLVLAVATRQRLNGNRVIELPSDAVQKRGFTHMDAEFLLKTYPKEFKKKVTKGKTEKR